MCFSSRCFVGLAMACTLAFAPVAHGQGGGYVTLTPNSLTTVTLNRLVSRDVAGVIVGDKIFDDFVYSSTRDMPDAEHVKVLGITDADGNLGIRFQGAFQDLPDFGFQVSSDAAVTYEVSINPEFVRRGWLITDAHLVGSGVGVAGQGSYITVDESFTGNNPPITSTLSVFESRLNQGGRQLEDSVVFNRGYTRLRVQKDILARASEHAILPARITIIDQTFSQSIPEPTAFVMAGLTLCGLLQQRGRRRA